MRALGQTLVDTPQHARTRSPSARWECIVALPLFCGDSCRAVLQVCSRENCLTFVSRPRAESISGGSPSLSLVVTTVSSRTPGLLMMRTSSLLESSLLIADSLFGLSSSFPAENAQAEVTRHFPSETYACGERETEHFAGIPANAKHGRATCVMQHIDLFSQSGAARHAEGAVENTHALALQRAGQRSL